MIQNNHPFTFERVARLAVISGIVWCLVLLLDHLSEILLPFFIGLVIAYFLHPITNIIQRVVTSRAIAAIITLVSIILVSFLIFRLMIPIVGNELTDMGQTVSKMATDTTLAKAARDRLPENIWGEMNEFLKNNDVKRYLTSDGAVKFLKDTSRKIMPGVWSLLSGATNVLIFITGLLVIMLYIVFLLIDYQNISNGWREYLPESIRGQVSSFLQEFILATNLYFRSQALVALFVALLFMVGFSIIDLPLAILMGLFIGLLNIVPYLQIIGIFPCLLLAGLKALEQGDSFLAALGLVVLIFVSVQIIQETLLVPRIQGKAMGLSPAIILLSISVWGKLLGFLGLILALPLTCLGLTYYRSFIQNQSTDTNLIDEDNKTG